MIELHHMRLTPQTVTESSNLLLFFHWPGAQSFAADQRAQTGGLHPLGPRFHPGEQGQAGRRGHGTGTLRRRREESREQEACRGYLGGR